MNRVRRKWKTDKYFRNHDVSNFGEVLNAETGNILKNVPNEDGYLIVSLCKEGCSKTFYVHHLVARNYLRPPNPGEELNHIDGDKNNCRWDNLEWLTRAENMKHAYRLGLKKAYKGNATLISSEVEDIRGFLEEGHSAQFIAEMYRVSEGTILHIKYNRTWRKK